MTISRKGVTNRDPFELIKLSYCLNKKRFCEEFDKVNITIDSEDKLQGLAEICKNKRDTAGFKFGDRTIMFDTLRIIESQDDYSQEELDSIKLLLVD